MKKISSIILALILALSLATTAFADGPESIKPGDTKHIYLEQTEDTSYIFTASSTGAYKLSVEMENNGFASFEIYNFENSEEDLYFASVDSELSEAFVFPASKGSSFEIDIYEASGAEEFDDDYYDTESEITITLEKINAPSISVGNTYKVTEDSAYYLFTPSKSGNYNFRSSADSTRFDPIISTYDEYAYSNSYNDDIGYDGNYNFDLSAYYEKGELYLVAVDTVFFEDEDYDNINYSFKVSSADNIKPEYITVYDSDSISMAKRDYTYISGAVIPSGSRVNIDYDDISVYSSNPRVADVTYTDIYDGEIEVEVTSYKLGKTTITFELANGEKTEIKVKVKSRFILFFENLFSRLFGR